MALILETKGAVSRYKLSLVCYCFCSDLNESASSRFKTCLSFDAQDSGTRC